MAIYLLGLLVFPAGAPDLPLLGFTGLLLGPLLLFQSVAELVDLKADEPEAAFAGRSPRSDFPALEAGALPLEGPAGLVLAEVFLGVTLTASGSSLVFLTTLFGAVLAVELDLATRL